MNKQRIALLMGGWSSEREVSLTGGVEISKALRALGHEVLDVDVGRDLGALVKTLQDFKTEFAFNNLHGRWGEDGCIQAVLEILKIPYSHSNVMASAIAMDKPITKKIVAAAGVRVADGQVLSHADIRSKGFPFPAPFVIKPPNEGSSVGVRIVLEGHNFDPTKEEWTFGENVLIEKYIRGRELTVGLMGPKALTVTEIKPTVAFYDYTAKYTDGFATHVCPAELPDDVTKACLQIAETCYTALGCNGVARIDIRYDDSMQGTDGLYFLELNTQPGFTPLSLVPEQAAALGISFKDLCQWIVEHPVIPA